MKKKITALLIPVNDQAPFLFCGLIIIEATNLVVGVTATSDLDLRTSYKFLYIFVRLNVPEFPLNKKANNSNEVKLLFI